MSKIHDIHVEEMLPFISPRELKKELPLTEKAIKTVLLGRETIQNILSRKDKRIMVMSGPCSIHDEKAAMDYARRLCTLGKEVEDVFFPVMRIYFEKPRTTVGWKGLINDPFLNGTQNIIAGLKKARRILLEINEMGMPAASEVLDPITPQYMAGLISWAAIGARTTESQTHRELASGLSMPVGFKNGTDGNLKVAVNAMQAAKVRQRFLGLNNDGSTCLVQTTGNPWTHIVLRGGDRPNYDPVSIDETLRMLVKSGLPDRIVVDCSHANSGKRFKGQPFVWKNVIDQRLDGNDALVGLMLESFLNEGSQKILEDLAALKYGISVTDECISWETTEELILKGGEKLRGRL